MSYPQQPPVSTPVSVPPRCPPSPAPSTHSDMSKSPVMSQTSSVASPVMFPAPQPQQQAQPQYQPQQPQYQAQYPAYQAQPQYAPQPYQPYATAPYPPMNAYAPQSGFYPMSMMATGPLVTQAELKNRTESSLVHCPHCNNVAMTFVKRESNVGMSILLIITIVLFLFTPLFFIPLILIFFVDQSTHLCSRCNANLSSKIINCCC